MLALLWLLETLAPLFERRSRLPHALRHGAIALINFVPLFFLAYATAFVGQWTEERTWGLLNAFDAPLWVEFAIAILLIDFWMYAWHRLNHRVPLLWRFHRMHHTDTEMDATSAFRFHMGELVLSALLRLPLMMVLGLTVWQVLLYEVLLLPVVLFHHSNVAISGRLDQILRMVIVTPWVHWIHHSRLLPETDSNYSSIFSWWDRLFRTFRLRKDPRTIRYGLDGWDDPKRQSVGGMLATPVLPDPSRDAAPEAEQAPASD